MLSKLFMLLILPVSLFVFYFNRPKDNRAHLLLVMFIGLFVSAVFVAFKIFFNQIYYLPEVSFLKMFLYIFLGQTFIPVAAVWGIFMLFDRKDTVSQRVSCFFPLMASFYVIYMPYRILDTDLPYPGFYLFVKPVLFLAFLALVHKILHYRIDNPPLDIVEKIVLGINTVLVFVLPALIETVWFKGMSFIIWFSLFAVYALLAGLIIVKK